MEELETDHEEWARKEIARAGGHMQKIVFPGRRGAPDNIILWPHGVVDLAEFKARRGVISHNQETVHETFRRYGKSVWLLYTREETAMYIQTRRPKRRA